jgi:hypothetical protein
MKFQIPKIKKISNQPKIGEKRQVSKFAFLPKRLDDKTVIWFENYISVQKYKKVHVPMDGGGSTTNKWVEKHIKIPVN